MASTYDEMCSIYWDLNSCKSDYLSLIIQHIRQYYVSNVREFEFCCFTVKDIEKKYKNKKKYNEIETKNNIKIIQREKSNLLYTVLIHKISAFIEKSEKNKFRARIILITGCSSLSRIIENLRYSSNLLLIHRENAPIELTNQAERKILFEQIEAIALKNKPLSTTADIMNRERVEIPRYGTESKSKFLNF
jgi:hypothetical protein